MSRLWQILSAISILVLTYAFLRWYIKGHFGRYFILFWVWTILSMTLFINAKSKQEKYDNTPGYVYWERNLQNH